MGVADVATADLKDCAFCELMGDIPSTRNKLDINAMQKHFRWHHHIAMQPMLSVRVLK